MKCTVDGCEKPHYGRGLCKAHHQWRWSRGLIEPRPTLTERFNAGYEMVTESGCWLWGKCLQSKGYGQFWKDGKVVYAHRASWEIYRGAIPAGLDVLHHCDVPSCVNPAHLFLGSHQENMRDMVQKGRSARGEKSVNTTLKESDVIAIRTDPRSHRAVGLDFNLSRTAVQHIRRRRTWDHVA